MKNKKMTISTLIVLFFFLMFISTSINNNKNNYYSSSFEQTSNRLKASSSTVNGKSLLVNQYANISKSIAGDTTSPKNVSFNLAPDWTSKNVTINYEGVAQKKDWVTNGGFDSDMSGWTYKEKSVGGIWSNEGYDGGEGNPSGSVKFHATEMEAGAYAYFEQNVSIPDEFGSGNAILSADVKMHFDSRFNGSLFVAVIINNKEVNISINAETIPNGEPYVPLSLIYNPIIYGQVLPNNATIRVGLYGYEDKGIPSWQEFNFDNVKFAPWTKPNNSNIIIANDNEFNQ